MIVPTCSPASARRDQPWPEPVDHLDLGDVPRAAHQVEQRALDDHVGQVEGDQLVHGDPRDQRRRRVGLGVGGVEAVLVLDEDHAAAAVRLGDQVAPRVGAVGRDDALGRHGLPHVIGRHPGEDRRAGRGHVERQRGEGGAADHRHPVAGHEVAEHLGVLPGDGGADVGEHAGRQPEPGGHRVHVPRPRATAGADQQLVLRLGLRQLLDDRVHRRPAPVHEALAADLEDVRVGEDPVSGRRGRRRGQLGVVERAREQRRLELRGLPNVVHVPPSARRRPQATRAVGAERGAHWRRSQRCRRRRDDHRTGRRRRAGRRRGLLAARAVPGLRGDAEPRAAGPVLAVRTSGPGRRGARRPDRGWSGARSSVTPVRPGWVVAECRHGAARPPGSPAALRVR